MTTSPIVDKIRKMLALASDPSITEAEAANYAAMIATMLQAHGLSLSDVPEAERDDGVVQETWEPKYAHDGWRRLIAQAAAELYMCDLIGTKVATRDAHGNVKFDREGRTVRVTAYILVGRPHSVAIVQSMCDYLFATVVRLGRQYSRVRPEALEFERGCGYRLSQRLQELREQAVAPAQASGGLPALYDSEADLVAKFIAANIKTHSVTVHAVRSGDNSHALAGITQADSVSLNPQVAGSSRSTGSGRLLS